MDGPHCLVMNLDCNTDKCGWQPREGNAQLALALPVGMFQPDGMTIRILPSRLGDCKFSCE
uniref:Uncharacterized protein n=1 Tax=Anguilla anguilla TaxID=7936 RepID=A0A0E9UDU6_ANGAN